MFARTTPALPHPRPQTDAEENANLRQVFAAFSDAEPAALCFSGGGIRSATFGLGVIQGLARHGALETFHYLSTVSGGGYIGSWLSAWIHRFGRDAAVATLAAKAVGDQVAAESPQVDHLRDYSNYLNPRLGLLSADTWALAATVVRNLFLNWLVLLPVIAILVTVPQLWATWLVALAGRDGQAAAAFDLLGREVAVGIAFVALVVSVAYVQVDLPGGGDRRRGQTAFLWWYLLPLVLAAAFFTRAWCSLVVSGGTLAVDGVRVSADDIRAGSAWTAFAVVGALVHVVGFAVGLAATRVVRRGPAPSPRASAWRRERFLARALQWLIVPIAGALGGVGLWVVLRTLPSDTTFLVCVAPPLLLGVYFAATVACVGLLSHVTTDEDREWWARAGGWTLAASLGWLVVTAASLYAPRVGAGVRWAVASAGGVTGILTFLAGRSSHTSAGRRADCDASKTGSTLDWALKLGAPLFLLFVVVGFAWLMHWLPYRWLGVPEPAVLAAADPALAALVVDIQLWAIALLAGLCAVAAATVDVNRFSLHAMYRARLIRAYLGASRPRTGEGCRDPNPFTGFDPDDNLPMAALEREAPVAGHATVGVPPIRRPAALDVRAAGQLPFHVVNVALNLVKGTRLAWQHRKAASFTFTPLHAGSAALADEVRAGNGRPVPTPPERRTAPTIKGAYQPIGRYGGDDGVTLGTAVAISGAAVSPNMGYHSSAVVTFLLALFNARLGWWLPNPGWAGAGVVGRSPWPDNRFGTGRWRKRGPGFALRPYLAEAFGLTNDSSSYVYLSDGGHFENLGLYEMVLRRCRTILVVDGGCDPGYQFEDLGNAIRKIRIDLGIRIDFPEALPMDRSGEEHVRHFAQGAIHYADVDGDQAPAGTIYYVKPVLTGDETVDVRNYHATHPDFPHESTSDQWFDEDQFETYRMLGLHSIEQWCAAIGSKRPPHVVAA